MLSRDCMAVVVVMVVVVAAVWKYFHKFQQDVAYTGEFQSITSSGYASQLIAPLRQTVAVGQSTRKERLYNISKSRLQMREHT